MAMTASRLVFDDKERVAAWVAERVGHLSSWGDCYAMGVELDGELVSGVVLNGMTDSNATCHIAVNKPTKGLSELLDHAFVYAFGQLKLRRLTAFIEEANEKSLKLNSHIGFVDEGVMRSAGTNGQDVRIRVLWPQNYRKGKFNG
jgi:RimJ/RimL family protein N-acetyltransferase